ncbi:MAG TPA: cytochrome ubiquinol oxidase subunit I, partial [Ktedonobacterales bacterium]|nr:cytochrome ubiquinol oxidase subunit I [Ktedonobacterales bacterium]
GSITGTVVGTQLSLLWPNFMALIGNVISLPFAIEVFPFFIEAIFLAIYVYGWDRIRNPWLHWAASLPIVVASAASGALITTVNAFMNTPAGFALKNGQPVNINPVAAMFNPTTPSEVSHVVITAYLSTAVALAGMAAFRLLRRPQVATGMTATRVTLPMALRRLGFARTKVAASATDATSAADGQSALSLDQRAYHLRVLLLAMGVSAVGAALAILSGDSSAKSVAQYQPEKLAAMEARFDSQTHAALTIGGIVDQAHHRVIGGINIPDLLSWLAYGDPNAKVRGLDSFSQSMWPPLMIHYTFDAMVGLGMWLGALTFGFWALYIVRRSWATSRLLLWAIALSLPTGYVAMELGWMTTELGRQPWILYHIMTVTQAFTSSPYVPALFFLFMGTYVSLSVATIYVLTRYYRAHPLPAVIVAANGTGANIPAPMPAWVSRTLATARAFAGRALPSKATTPDATAHAAEEEPEREPALVGAASTSEGDQTTAHQPSGRDRSDTPRPRRAPGMPSRVGHRSSRARHARPNPRPLPTGVGRGDERRS